MLKQYILELEVGMSFTMNNEFIYTTKGGVVNG